MERADLKKLVLATGCAVEHGATVFLCDPHWNAAEKEAFARLTSGGQRTEDGIQATVSSQSAPSSVLRPLSSGPSAHRADGWLAIRTGGTGGGMKFALHDEHTLSAAVRGFCTHFNRSRVNAVDVLPPWHVSGLMARVRCAATGGTHLAWDWKKLEAGDFPPLSNSEPQTPNSEPNDSSSWLLSLVPTQLHRLLARPAAVAWLRQFQIVFLGGGPTWPELTDDAARVNIPLSLSYGLTETAAMVTALRPADFLAGDRSSGPPLPHAQIHIAPEGRVVVAADSLFRGYFAASAAPSSILRPPSSEFLTDDLGRIDARGHLHILGRADAVIITGGEKVNPTEVEAALRASGEFSDIAVLGLPDPEWGQIVVACHPAATRPPDLTKAVAALAPHQRPKRFIPISDWPRNAQGKVIRDQLLAHAKTQSPRSPSPNP